MPKTVPLKEIEEFERETDLGSLQYLDDNDHNWCRGCMKRAVFCGMVFGCIINLSACTGTVQVSEEIDEKETFLCQSEEAGQEDSEMIFLNPVIEEETSEKIRRCYKRYSADQMDNLVQYISNIIGIIGSRKADMGEGITTFCTFLAHNKEKLWAFVLAFFKFGENIEFRSEALVAPLLKYFDCRKEKDSIWNASFPMKKQWQFTYYEMIAENEVTQDDYRRLMELVTESTVVCEKEKFEINLRLLDKFKKYSPNIYVSITKALLNEVENNTSLCRRYFRKLLSFDGKNELDSRKEQWIIHYIRENSNSENLIELFSHLSLVSNSWTGTSSLTDKIIFCEELLSEISGVQFLKHKKRIRDEIAKWKAVRNREEVDEILMKLYQ